MKKISQIIHLLFLSIALFSSALLAQQAPPVTAQGVHLGTKNKYSIGTSDTPVLAPEYKDFLNAQSSSDRPWIESSYYDSSFMNASNNWSWQNNPKAAIYRDDTSGDFTYRDPTSGTYYYSVISGHENDIIDAVYSQSIQQEFNSWRDANAAEAAAKLLRNPTRQELCDYINDKIAGKLDPSYLDKATEIQNRYPKADAFPYVLPGGMFATSEEAISLWRRVDDLVAAIYGEDTEDSTLRVDKKGNAYTTITHTSASDNSVNDYITHWGLAVSEDQDSGFPANMPKHIVMMDGNDPEQRAAWGTLHPRYSYRNGADMNRAISFKMDLSVTTRIPYNPPAPDNGDTPAAQN